MVIGLELQEFAENQGPRPLWETPNQVGIPRGEPPELERAWGMRRTSYLADGEELLPGLYPSFFLPSFLSLVRAVGTPLS